LIFIFLLPLLSFFFISIVSILIFLSLYLFIFFLYYFIFVTSFLIYLFIYLFIFISSIFFFFFHFLLLYFLSCFVSSLNTYSLCNIRFFENICFFSIMYYAISYNLFVCTNILFCWCVEFVRMSTYLFCQYN
jgi:hypothetical protein